MSKTLSLLVLLGLTLVGFTVVFQVGAITAGYFVKRPPPQQMMSYDQFIQLIIKPENMEKDSIRVLLRGEFFTPQKLVFFKLKGENEERWAALEVAPGGNMSTEEWLRQLGYQNIRVQAGFPWGYLTWQTIQATQMSVTSTLGLFIFIYFITTGQFAAMREEVSTLRAAKKLVGPKITLDDVAGIDQERGEAREFIDFMKDMERFRAVQAKPPKGILLHGPPGTGKSLLARAICHDSGLPYFWMSGADFNFMFVGVGARRAEILFDEATRAAPSIIVIDELDSAAPRRTGLGAHESKERVNLVNKLLSLLDQVEKGEVPVFVFGITNNIEALDPALLREGRFDRKIEIPYPMTVEAREEILKVHVTRPKPKPLAPEIDLRKIAEQIIGFSGASIATLANEAAIRAYKAGRKTIIQEDFIESIERVLAGQERLLRLSEKERETVAYHEAGHTLTTYLLPQLDKARLVTIVPRGKSLGHTWAPHRRDYYLENKQRLLAKIMLALGGFVAEKVSGVVGEGVVTNGSSSDLKMATGVAQQIVLHFGMGKKGPVYFDGLDQPSSWSEQMKYELDQDVVALVKKAEEELAELFSQSENKAKLEKIAKALLEKKRLTDEQIEALINA